MSMSVDQAFVDAYVNDNSAFGIAVTGENLPYGPTDSRTPYAELITLPNPTERLSADTVEMTGLFRVILRYPLDRGDFEMKTKAEAILAAFPIDSVISYGGQNVQIINVHRGPGNPEKGWFKAVITLGYQAFKNRS